MRKSLLFLLALLPLMAYAYDAKINGIYYNFSDYDAIVTFQKIMKVEQEDGTTANKIVSDYTGDIIIPETVIYDGKKYRVAAIGEYAFNGSNGVTSVTIPKSVGSIAKAAFLRCELSSVTIPESVKSIGQYAFYECKNLTSVNIPNGVKSLEYASFVNCSSLTSVTIPESVESIGEWTFSNCSSLPSITIPEGVKSIGFGTFQDCTALATATIPKSVTSIGGQAFTHCSSLSTINIPEGVKEIGNSAFRDCTALASVTLTNNLTDIESGAFIGCEVLTSITIPKSVTNIGVEVFGNCYRLESITVEEGNTVYDSRGNCNAIIETATNTLISGCQNTVIPESVTTIGASSYWGVKGLTKLNLPDNLTTIDNGAFNACTGLTSITIPEKVDSIGWGAFQFCENLTEVYCLAANVPRTHIDAFWGVPYASITLYVPASAIDKYKATEPWSKFGNILPLTTPVNDILFDELTAGSQSYYDLQGRRIGNKNRGLNIIRHPDGTSRKVLLK